MNNVNLSVEKERSVEKMVLARTSGGKQTILKEAN